MARELVDRAFCSLDSQLLESVVSFNLSKSDPKTPVDTMVKRRRSIGTTRGTPKFSADMVVVLFAGTGEKDWDALMVSSSYHLIGYEKGDGGERRQLVDAWIDDIGEPYQADGETRVSIKWGALNDRAVP